MSTSNLHNSARGPFATCCGPVTYYRLVALEEAGLVELD